MTEREKQLETVLAECLCLFADCYQHVSIMCPNPDYQKDADCEQVLDAMVAVQFELYGLVSQEAFDAAVKVKSPVRLWASKFDKEVA